MILKNYSINLLILYNVIKRLAYAFLIFFFSCYFFLAFPKLSDFKNQALIKSFQTYSAVNGSLLHSWDNKSDQEETLYIKRIFSPKEGGPHTGYFFLKMESCVFATILIRSNG